ncbi:MAG: hypothetical protein M5U01_26035 [Ardenticatenaceae bacterium]|nr:hypothetical protein [Ardenticatenaceae bacterium]HBY96718.1 hypothetical protein [Chloroflexota bacterium]
MPVAAQSRAGPGFPVRVLWFVLIGWWATFLCINVAWLLNATIIFLPIGLWMLNRVPKVLTLQPERTVLVGRSTRGGDLPRQPRAVPQEAFVVRALWFVLVGWWLSLIWANLAWAAAATIILLPVSVWLLNRLPAVTTLHRH